jgi:hypothetical protein
MATRKLRQPYLPTTEQIRHECRQIQRTWSEPQRRDRLTKRTREVRVPCYAVKDLPRAGALVVESAT